MKYAFIHVFVSINWKGAFILEEESCSSALNCTAPSTLELDSGQNPALSLPAISVQGTTRGEFWKIHLEGGKKKNKPKQKKPRTNSWYHLKSTAGRFWLVCSALGCGVLMVQRGSKGQSLSDPKNPYLRTWLFGLRAPCAAQRGGAGGNREGSQWKIAPVGFPISEVMHNHIPA